MKQSDEPPTDRMEADLVQSDKMSSSNLDRVQTLAVLLVGVVAVIALVFSAIALARPGTLTLTGGVSPEQSTKVPEPTDDRSSEQDDSKIWVFAVGHDGTILEYIHDLTGTVRGFHIDIVEAVCARANKNCQLMWDIYENCYKSKAGERPRPGVGLVSGWYDGCTGWSSTYERAVSVSFTKPFYKPRYSVFYVKRGNPRNFRDNILTGKTIGFVDGFTANENCLKRAELTGSDLPSDKIKHFMSRETLVQAVNNEEVDAVFANVNIYDLGADLDIAPGDPIETCNGEGAGIMLRKDSRLADWWNPAFEQLKLSADYRRICSEITEKHGGDAMDKEVVCVP